MIHRMWVLKLFAFSDEIMEQKVGQAPNVSSTFLGEKVTRISPGSRMDQENASKWERGARNRKMNWQGTFIELYQREEN